MNRPFCMVVVAVLVLLATSPAPAQVPMLLNYQGRLTDPSGGPKNGMFTMQFAVYDAETGGNQLPTGTPWSETQSVTVTSGVFNVLLGSVTALPANLFEGGPSDTSGPLRYLQVTVSGEVLAPRRRIVSAAYAIQSGTSGNDPDDVMVSVGSIAVDVYEASVWSSATGGTQYGTASADYPCGAGGNDCTNIYARSVAGVQPSRFITWFQAQQACKNAGKRLLTNAEWQLAAYGTPDPGTAGDGLTTCATNTAGPVPTGTTGNCVSNAGARDMVGNVGEWTSDWYAPNFAADGWGAFSDDYNTPQHRAITRGAGRVNGSETGSSSI